MTLSVTKFWPTIILKDLPLSFFCTLNPKIQIEVVNPFKGSRGKLPWLSIDICAENSETFHRSGKKCDTLFLTLIFSTSASAPGFPWFQLPFWTYFRFITYEEWAIQSPQNALLAKSMSTMAFSRILYKPWANKKGTKPFPRTPTLGAKLKLWNYSATEIKRRDNSRCGVPGSAQTSYEEPPIHHTLPDQENLRHVLMSIRCDSLYFFWLKNLSCSCFSRGKLERGKTAILILSCVLGPTLNFGISLGEAWSQLSWHIWSFFDYISAHSFGANKKRLTRTILRPRVTDWSYIGYYISRHICSDGWFDYQKERALECRAGFFVPSQAWLTD